MSPEKNKDYAVVLHVEEFEKNKILLTRTLNEPYGIRIFINPNAILSKDENYDLSFGDRITIQGTRVMAQDKMHKSIEIELEI